MEQERKTRIEIKASTQERVKRYLVPRGTWDDAINRILDRLEALEEQV